MLRHSLSRAVLLSLCQLVAAPVTAQTPGWHVPQAEMRFAFVLDPNWVGPADVFLADLPKQAGEGLVFDPVTKDAKPTEPSAKDKPAQVRGEAVFALKPEYKWLTFKAKGTVKVSADGHILKLPPPIDEVHFCVPILADKSSVKIHIDGDFLREAGFVTAGPKVARAVLHVPGQDPTKFVPLVYTDAGRQIGAATLWAQPGEPWVILFDSSTDARQYFVYPVDRKHDPARPNWIPEAGLILETRYLDRYDSKVKTLPGFQELWKQSNFVAGKMTQANVWRGFLPCPPMQYQADSFISKMLPRGAPFTLSRYVGQVRLPAEDEYRFHFQVFPAGFLVVDGQIVMDLSPAEARAVLANEKNPYKIAALKLSAGQHRIEVYQYGTYGQFHVSLAWSTASRKLPYVLGHGISLLEPIAQAVPSPKEALQGRDAGPLLLNIMWSDQDVAQCLGQWPAEDIVAWKFMAQLSAPTDGVAFRWRFDDGHKAEGASVTHVFCRTGLREVTVEAWAEKTGKLLASRTDRVRVQPRWDWPEGRAFHPLADTLKSGQWPMDIEELGKTEENPPSSAPRPSSPALPQWPLAAIPVEDLLNLHAWACQYRRNDLRQALAPAWAKRLDEVIAKSADDRLYNLGIALTETEENRYAQAEKVLWTTLAKLPPTSRQKKFAALDQAEKLRYAQAEKVLRAAVAQSPPASHQKKLAALALADLLVNIDAKPQAALDLFTQIDAERLEADVTDGWKFAPVLELPRDVMRTPLDQKLLEKVPWQQPPTKDDPKTKGKLPIRLGDKAWNGCWLMKEVTLPADRPQKPLVLDLGPIISEGPDAPLASPGMIWLNGEMLGEPWRWRAGRVVAPAKTLQPPHPTLSPPGGEGRVRGANQLVLLLESPASIDFFPKDRVPSFEMSGPPSGLELALSWQRAHADILLHLGKKNEAQKLLESTRAKSWPLDEEARIRLAGQLRSIRRLAASSKDDDPDNAIEQTDALLHDYPLLRLDPEVMLARVEAHLGRKEFQRALVLAGQMLTFKTLGETTRRQFLLAQVQATAFQGQPGKAEEFCKTLIALSPYSAETVRAREIIIQAGGK